MIFAMEWLNYHHLLYFWTVGRIGSVSRASAELRLTQATVSAQLKSLEQSLGEKLFHKSGRHLILTDTGKVVFRYAEEIFSLGQELMGTLKGRPQGRLARVNVGVTDIMPKLVAYRLIEPALKLKDPYRIICREGTNSELLAALAVHDIDVMLSDGPIDPAVNVKAFNHLLGECGVILFGAPQLAVKYRAGFPRSLDGAPFLLPTSNTTARRSIDQWLESRKYPADNRGGIRRQRFAESLWAARIRGFCRAFGHQRRGAAAIQRQSSWSIGGCDRTILCDLA